MHIKCSEGMGYTEEIFLYNIIYMYSYLSSAETISDGFQHFGMWTSETTAR
jgi:hypothetical protein